MEEYITYGDLKIRCNIKIERILDLSIKESIGTHAIAMVKAELEPGSFSVSGEEMNSQPIKIYRVENQKEILLFSGVISKICVEKESFYEILSLTSYSLSWLMDLEKKSRSFQDCNKSISQLVQNIAEETSFTVLSSAPDQAITKPFIQFEETDWEFILRLSTHLHIPVIPAADYEARGIYLGFQKKSVPLKLNVLREQWCMDADDAIALNCKTREASYYEVDTYQILHLGQCVSYRNEIMWTYSVKMNLQKGGLHCTYKLSGMNHGVYPTIYNSCIKGALLTGTVLERREETIKVHLDMDKEQDAGKAFFYLWSPEFGNLLYCMPETGSKVRLQIPRGDEQEAFGVSCVREAGQECAESLDPDNRWFRTTTKKKMELKPSDIKLSADKGKSEISMQDGFGNMIYSKGELLLQAKGKVTLHGRRIELIAPTEVTVVKRRLGNPAVVNICHNLDCIGENTILNNRYGSEGRTTGPSSDIENQQKVDKRTEERRKKDKEKMQLKMKELSEDRGNTYELGPSIVNVISAIPQSIEQDKLSQIAAGFRPIAGKMKGD
ncbi:contractile injection system protein, VgrG/Pvc8 family [Clostridium sp. E02]|uniref:contractile injection system protein, VgrG/Pvc8 family n=1 Tax=Clostridium sp. E02 TaxID=2487134 RepID=UPI000F53F1A1|nr:contractile injection system protein, VgrG/Pvc8 family [Clostridium sp. E02]